MASKTVCEVWKRLDGLLVGAEVCANGIKLHWESSDGKSGGMEMMTDSEARRFYEALKQVMEK